MTTSITLNNDEIRSRTITEDINLLIDDLNSQLAHDISEINALPVDMNFQQEHKDEVSSNETLHVSEGSGHNGNVKEIDFLFDSPISNEVEEKEVEPLNQQLESFDFFSRPSIVDQINSLKFPTSFSCEQKNCDMTFMTELNMNRHIVLEHFNYDFEDENDLNYINLVCNKCVQDKMCMFLFTDLHDYLVHYHKHETKEFDDFIDSIFVDLNREINNSDFMMLSNNDILSEKYSFVVKRNEMFEVIQMLNRLRQRQGLDI